jgi:fibronectin-binding autotransporter adhesin
MKQPLRARPSLEPLEDRWCPTVTASVTNGVLTVAGSPAAATDTVLVKETAAGTFEVDDGSTVIASGLTTVTSVKLGLTGATDIIDVDLGGNTLSGNLSAALGTTATTLTVADGTISGNLAVSGQGSADSVTVGGTGTTLTVAKDSSINLGSQAGNSVTVLSGATFSDDLFIAAASVTVNGTVGGNLDVSSTAAGGSCGGGFGFFRGFAGHGAHGSASSSSSLTLGSTGSVGGNLDFSANGSSDSVDIAGTVSSSLKVKLTGTTETATLESTASVGKADFTFGNGTDTLTLAGTIGASGGTGTVLSVTAGGGANTVSILDSAVINGSAWVKLGSGTNAVSLHDSATVTGTFALKAGTATTLHGSTQTNHATLDLTGFKGTQDSSPNP